mmetsp:Transcript_21042/g.32575  ORF Transcript_21042/g.32575 Transcript_21042/m.32575 type:complete len:90 (+) Transcript_21042:288-557(+)
MEIYDDGDLYTVTSNPVLTKFEGDVESWEEVNAWIKREEQEGRNRRGLILKNKTKTDGQAMSRFILYGPSKDVFELYSTNNWILFSTEK